MSWDLELDQLTAEHQIALASQAFTTKSACCQIIPAAAQGHHQHLQHGAVPSGEGCQASQDAQL